ncbi:MAG: hypothetical protein AAF226_02635 [Verrucomicrobiota bacterium]
MAFGFPAYHTGTFSLSDEAAADWRGVIKAVIHRLGWKVSVESDDTVYGTVSTSMSSWGEQLAITCPDGKTLSITSKCAAVTQCVDWGKNKSNVNALLMELKKFQDAGLQHTPPPLPNQD